MSSKVRPYIEFLRAEIAVVAALVAERVDEFPPLRACETVAAQHLPAQFTSFVGREVEMSDVRQILAAVQSILR
jgi:hypothetical protein